MNAGLCLVCRDCGCVPAHVWSPGCLAGTLVPHCCSCCVAALQMLRVQSQLQAENLRHQMQRDQASGLTTPMSSFSALTGEQPAL